MEHSAAFRQKQYAQDHTMGHREFWRAIKAEVLAEQSASGKAWLVDCIGCGLLEHIGSQPMLCPRCNGSGIEIA
jgi:hypothetical protein